MTVLSIARDMGDRIFHQIRSQTHNEPYTGNQIRLGDYTLVAAQRLPSVVLNLSGITYCRQNRTLFAITNEPPQVYNLDLGGNCLRNISLIGFEDTEGIAYLGGHRFAIIEEKKHTLTVVEIDDQTTTLYRSEVVSSLKVDMKDRDNKGFDGVTVDPAMHCIYLVNEKRPRQLMTVEGLAVSTEALQIGLNPDLVPRRFFLNDLSGLHFDPVMGHLFTVSDESKMISEVSLEGKRISFLDLEKGAADLEDDIPQAEGVTMDDAGNIYVVSEPNFFNRFSRPGEVSRALPNLSSHAGDISKVPVPVPPKPTVVPGSIQAPLPSLAL